jgi:hypothetical protein
VLFAIGIAVNLALFWLTTKYFGYHPWYVLLIGVVVLLVSLIIIGGIWLTFKENLVAGSVALMIITIPFLILIAVCINLLPLFGIVWVGSFFMESLKDHVMYWPNFWGSF